MDVEAAPDARPGMDEMNNQAHDDPAPPPIPPTPAGPARRPIVDILNELPQPNYGQGVDHISIEFHTSSGKEPKNIPMEKYAPYDYTKNPGAYPARLEEEPWGPFRTRLDFEIAELALTTHMNKKQITRLLSLFKRCIEDPGDFTISNATELESTWDLARSYKAAGVSITEYSTVLALIFLIPSVC